MASFEVAFIRIMNNLPLGLKENALSMDANRSCIYTSLAYQFQVLLLFAKKKDQFTYQFMRHTLTFLDPQKQNFSE